MFFLLISIICSVSVATLLKTARSKNIPVFQIININYLVAVCCAILAYRPQFNYTISDLRWDLYLPLGLLLPIVFFILAKAIKDNGIVKTDISQRLSLILPLAYAVIFWNDSLSFGKIIGLILGFISIFFLFYEGDNAVKRSNITSLIGVFLGYGIIDILFKKIATETHIPYTESLLIVFVLALIIASFVSIYKGLVKQEKFLTTSVIWGLGLGFLNFCNILFYLKAHKEFVESPTTVFACMNFGVILLSYIVGMIHFNEKITYRNTIGLVLSLIAVTLVTLSQLKFI